MLSDDASSAQISSFVAKLTHTSTLGAVGFEQGEALSQALTQHPADCAPALPAPLISALSARQAGTLFVALPTSARAKQALVWRWNPAQTQLESVYNKKALRLAQPHHHAKVYLLAPFGKVLLPDIAEGPLRGLDASFETKLEPSWYPLRDRLLTQPHDCLLPLDHQLSALLQSTEAVYVGLQFPSRTIYWRWDADAHTLRRLLNPK